MARVELDHIAHSYAPKAAEPAYALHPLDVVWEEGSACALLGPSGCGKTTLLNIISGLIAPSRGRLLFNGQDVTRLPTEKRNIAQVFQFPVIYDTMTVAGNLAFPLRNRGMEKRAIEVRVAEIAELLDLTRDLNKPARNLTADAKQKISLGRGLVRSDVAAVLFDEPLTVIDPALKWELRSKLKEVHRALNVLMIYVTHDQVEALTFADQVMVMRDGEVLQRATPAELFETPEHTFVGYFIGSPGMNFLEADVAGHQAKVAGTVFELGRSYTVPAGSTKVQIGFRPDYARTAPSGDIPVKVRRIEDLGRRRLARLALGPHEIYATVPHDVTIDGEDAALTIPPNRLFVYVDGRRIIGEDRR
ncbi:MAG: ABC transporter ATP-binding protein [Ancalomicrobiaceae bacterium]|nr:ABC transporter ATP-binding protein [Ancalomicrobiaceae bacterium]